MAPRALPPGIGSVFEFGMRFAHWAGKTDDLPTACQVMKEFSVSRATAFRYIDAYRNFVSLRDSQTSKASMPRVAILKD